MSDMESQNLSFQEYGLIQSKKIAMEQKSFTENNFLKFIHNADQSLKDLKNLNKNADMDINKYVELYNSKFRKYYESFAVRRISRSRKTNLY